jgi:serine/threonine-protein kinase
LSVPQQIDRYLVERELGRGAFGVVFRARHAVTGRAVALKVLHTRHVGDAELVERFFREARASTRSPHIVDVLDASLDADGAPFLALELLEGSDLESVLERDGPLRTEDAVRIARELALGLEAAHRQGVVHRDLKPANVFLARLADGTTRTKILDFGMSKLAEPHASPHRTVTGAVMGTPLYMAPEQIAGRSNVADARADLYALGAILFEMLTGTTPHTATSLEALVTAKLTQPARELASLVPSVDPALAALVHRCLALRPEDRPASAAEVEQALAGLGRAPSARPSTPTRSASKVATAPSGTPHWAIAVLAAALLGTMCFAGIAVLGAGGTVWALFVSPRSSPQGANPPVEPTPEALSPAQTTPERAIPEEASPPSVSPVQASPPPVSPVQASPVQASPPPVSPVQASPVQASPVQASPVEASATGTAPEEANTVQTSPVQASPAAATPLEARPVERGGDGVSISVARVGGGDVSIERAIAEAARPALARCRGERRIVEEVQFLWIGARLHATQSVPTPPTASRRCIEDALSSTRHAGASTGIVRFQVMLEAR